MIEDARQHLIDKFGENGYATSKIYFGKEEYNIYLKDLSSLTNDKDRFRKKCNEILKKINVSNN